MLRECPYILFVYCTIVRFFMYTTVYVMNLVNYFIVRHLSQNRHIFLNKICSQRHQPLHTPFNKFDVAMRFSSKSLSLFQSWSRFNNLTSDVFLKIA